MMSKLAGSLLACLLAASPLVTAAPAADFTSQQLAQQTIHRRAVDAVIWGLPLVGDDRLYSPHPAVVSTLARMLALPCCGRPPIRAENDFPRRCEGRAVLVFAESRLLPEPGHRE